MNRNSLSKILALVFALVCTGYQNTLFAQANKGGVFGVQSEKASFTDTLQRQLESLNSRCDALEKEKKASLSGFLGSCKEEFKKKIRVAKTRDEAIKKCSEEIDTCANFSEGEQEFPEVTNMMLKNLTGQELMPNWPSGTADSKRCSKYTADKLESAIDRAQSALDTKKKEKRDLVKEAAKSEQDMQKELQEMQKNLLKGQKEKAEKAKENKEQERNQESAYKSKQAEFKSQMDKIDQDIFQLQQQQSLLMVQRGQEINVYKMALLICKKETKELLKSNVGNLSSNVSQASQSDAKAHWASCTQRALTSRLAEAKKFQVALDGLNKNIQYKYKELAAVEQAARDLEKMYGEAKAEQSEYNLQQDQAFINDQRQILSEMDVMAGNIRSKSFQNQQFLQEAETAIYQASNKLRDYESQEARGNKSIEDAGAKITDYAEAESSLKDLNCATKKKELESKIQDMMKSSQGAQGVKE